MALIKSILVLPILISSVLMQRNSGGLPEISQSERQFRVVYEWKTLDFSYRREQDRLNALYSKEFIPQNNLMSDVKPYGKRLYVTIPRMLPGVPATLGYIVAPDNNGRTDPEIEPYPSWAMNERGNCSALQFVQGIAIDADGILWAVDSGRTETLAPVAQQKVCNPKIMLFDLKRNGTLLRSYEFPEDVAPRGTNYLNKIVLDDANGGYAYITDNSGSDPGIIVYARGLNRSWKIRENNSMRAAKNAVAFSVNGTNLNFSIHIDGIALGPYYNPNIGTSNTPLKDGLYNNPNYERNVYYCPLSSYHLYSIPASLLRDPEFARRATARQVLEAVTDHGLKISQTDGMIMDNLGILYYGLLKEHAIAQWDSYKPFTYDNQNVIAKDDVHIQWIDGMGFDEEGYLYVVVNRLHNFVAGRLNPDETNFRILRAKTGTNSYVYTGLQNAFNPDIGNNIPEIFENGISGVSSTTPIYSQLGSIGPTYTYRNSASTNRLPLFSFIATIFITIWSLY